MQEINEFLQSDEWRTFQESAGCKTHRIKENNFCANIIEHQLPIVGKYFYAPRGPIIVNPKSEIRNLKSETNSKFKIQNSFSGLISLARKNNAGWIRIEPNNSHTLDLISEHWHAVKAPHDVQPREILVMDITKPEEQLLAEMKPKTRYNIKLAQKRGVSVKAISNFQFPISDKISNAKGRDSKFYINKFVELVKITAKRGKITAHPENYYRKMFETIPGEILKLYVAEYKGKIIAANIMIFYGDAATYLHGASDNEHRNVMAPHLLQWRAMRDAKKSGFSKYDLGGVRTENQKSKIKNQNDNEKLGNENMAQDTKYQIPDTDWQGITRFKTGFAPDAKPIKFPGSYDIILKSFQYNLYRTLQKIKNLF